MSTILKLSICIILVIIIIGGIWWWYSASQPSHIKTPVNTQQNQNTQNNQTAQNMPPKANNEEISPPKATTDADLNNDLTALGNQLNTLNADNLSVDQSLNNQ